jgi:hypothetical protein
MSELLRFFKDMRDNGYGLAEIAAQLGTSAIAEPVAGFAAMYDPQHGADAIREGMTYQPRTQEAQQYSQSIGNAAKTAIKPAMPIIDTWKKGVDIAGGYSPVAGAMLRTVPAAIGIAMGAKPALQAGRQVSNSLGSMQARMVANANAPRTLNTGYMGQRGAIGTLSTDDDLRALARFNQMDDVYKFDNSHEYYDPIDKLVARNLSDDSFDFMELPTSYGKMSITPSAKEKGKWQVTQWAKDGNPLSDSGNLTKEKALRVFFEDSRPELLSPPKRPLTEFEQAHLTAQRNAALPVDQGGLGLPADNTAMDRASAMGFDVDNPVYHGTGANIDAFDLSRSGSASGAEQYGTGVYTTTNPTLASGYANSTVQNANVLPLVTRMANPISDETAKKLTKAQIKKIIEQSPDLDEQLWNYGDVGYEGKNKVLNDAVNSLYEYQGDKMLENLHPIANDFFKNNPVEFNNAAAKVLKKDGVVVSFPRYNEKFNIPWNANQVRSRFAAFDPFNRDSSNLLAQSAKLAPTTALGAYMYNEKRKKSQGKQ